ncbi:MAG TPA: amidase family protein, partial [Thermomicrobiales bacterium]|nr:amidase family protein [Thermomicrobiales bacterium]
SIARCEAAAGLNALVSWDHDALRHAARAVDRDGPSDGALAGIPLVLKDNINTAFLPTSGGTGALKGFVAKADAPVAAALFGAGALLGGKGNMHELAFGITNNNAVTGAARNPYDPTKIPGGSSGGVAAAVAARMMPAGVGTDTGASVRLPAALCGLVGFRPTVGRYSGAGIVPISHTRDTAGPIARSVADAALLDAIMAADGTALPGTTVRGLRIGLPRAYFYQDLDPEVARIASETLAALADAGAVLVEADVENLDALNAAVGFPVALYEFARDLPAYLQAGGLDLTMADILAGIGSPDVKGIVASQLGEQAMPAATYLQALNVDRPLLQKAFAEYFASKRIDAILF